MKSIDIESDAMIMLTVYANVWGGNQKEVACLIMNEMST